MDCALWLNRRKVFSADELPANFDIAAIRGYFLGGSLAVWLSEHGGEEYARAVSSLDPSDPCLNDRLSEIFIGRKCEAPVHRADERLIGFIDGLRSGSSVSDGSAPSVFGSFSSSLGYNFGSYNYGSHKPSSYRAWLREWELYLGSFRRRLGAYYGSFGYGSGGYGYSFGYGSYNYGSYNLSSYRSWLWAWEWELYLGSFRKRAGAYFGSFGYGSGGYRNNFGYGSYNYSGSFGVLGSYLFGYGSYRLSEQGSFGALGSYLLGYGSFAGGSFAGCMLTPDEYDEIMLRTLGICPLNRYGYGIHLI